MAGSGFHFQYQGGGGGGGGDFELPPGLNNQVLTMVDEDTQTVEFRYIEFPGTEDYYVSEGVGVDEPNRGSILAPFQTIQYAISQVPPNKNIIVRGGSYYFAGTEKLHYTGKITGEPGAAIYCNLNTNEYLIDNHVTLSIAGVFEFGINSGKFIKNTASFGSGTLSVDFKSLISYTAQPIIYLANTSSTILKNGTMTTPDYAVVDLFMFENLGGAFFTFENIGFVGYTLTFRNYAANGGVTFRNCSFYGTTSFFGKAFHVKIGKGNQDGRPAAFINCSFDIVSLQESLPNAAAIFVTEADAIFSISKCTFDRRSDPTLAIYTQYNCTIAMFNIISVGLIGGAGTVDQVLTNQFNYISAYIPGLRF